MKGRHGSCRCGGGGAHERTVILAGIRKSKVFIGWPPLGKTNHRIGSMMFSIAFGKAYTTTTSDPQLTNNIGRENEGPSGSIQFSLQWLPLIAIVFTLRTYCLGADVIGWICIRIM